MAVGTLEEEGRGAWARPERHRQVGAAGFLICMSPRGLLLTESYLKPVFYIPGMSLSLTEYPMILSLHQKVMLLRKKAPKPNLGL